MLLQIGLGVELFVAATFVAGKRSFAGVEHNVLLEIVPPWKCLPATGHRAHECTFRMLFDVGIEQLLTAEHFVALWLAANERTLDTAAQMAVEHIGFDHAETSAGLRPTLAQHQF